MKNLFCMMALLLSGSVSVMAQQKPKEVKQETEVKTIKVNDGEKITEKKIKVITREENDIDLDANDEQKVNQERISSATKVEKTVLVDNDDDSGYDTLSKVTYYKLGDENYIFTPNESGFVITCDNDTDGLAKVCSAWVTGSKGHYIVDDKTHNGIGYFDNEGNLVVEFYNKDSNQIESKTYTVNQ